MYFQYSCNVLATYFSTQVLKLYAWEESFLSIIKSKRAKELKFLLKSRLWKCLLSLIYNSSPTMVSADGELNLTQMTDVQNLQVEKQEIVINYLSSTKFAHSIVASTKLRMALEMQMPDSFGQLQPYYYTVLCCVFPYCVIFESD